MLFITHMDGIRKEAKMEENDRGLNLVVYRIICVIIILAIFGYFIANKFRDNTSEELMSGKWEAESLTSPDHYLDKTDIESVKEYNGYVIELECTENEYHMTIGDTDYYGEFKKVYGTGEESVYELYRNGTKIADAKFLSKSKLQITVGDYTVEFSRGW